MFLCVYAFLLLDERSQEIADLDFQSLRLLEKVFFVIFTTFTGL